MELSFRLFGIVLFEDVERWLVKMIDNFFENLFVYFSEVYFYYGRGVISEFEY